MGSSPSARCRPSMSLCCSAVTSETTAPVRPGGLEPWILSAVVLAWDVLGLDTGPHEYHLAIRTLAQAYRPLDAALLLVWMLVGIGYAAARARALIAPEGIPTGPVKADPETRAPGTALGAGVVTLGGHLIVPSLLLPLSIRPVVHVSSPAAATSPQNCGSGTSGTQSVRNASVGERRAARIDGQGGDGTNDQGGAPPRRRGRRQKRGLGVGPRTRERSGRDVEPSGDIPWRRISAWRCSPISTATAARRWPCSRQAAADALDNGRSNMWWGRQQRGFCPMGSSVHYADY